MRSSVDPGSRANRDAAAVARFEQAVAVETHPFFDPHRPAPVRLKDDRSIADENMRPQCEGAMVEDGARGNVSLPVHPGKFDARLVWRRKPRGEAGRDPASRAEPCKVHPKANPQTLRLPRHFPTAPRTPVVFGRAFVPPCVRAQASQRPGRTDPRRPAATRMLYPGAPAPSGSVFPHLLLENNCGIPAVPLARRDAIATANGFDAALQTCEDYDLWLRLSRTTPFSFLPAPIAICWKAQGKHAPAVRDGRFATTLRHGTSRTLCVSLHGWRWTPAPGIPWRDHTPTADARQNRRDSRGVIDGE
jgi:hypothetical protein